MTSTNGADIRRAIAAFRRAGYTVRAIADDLDVHPSTVYRWAAGTRTPRPANLSALAALIDARHSQHIHRRRLTPAAMHLQAAAEALETDTERAEADETADRLRADMAARAERDEAEQAQRDADAVRRRDEAYRSVTQDADVFAVVATAQPREVAMFS